MTIRQTIKNLLNQEDLNFLLTNRLPRRRLTLLMSRFSRIEQPWLRDLSIAVWRTFADVDLSDARKTSFTSLHDCFIRELREVAPNAEEIIEVIQSGGIAAQPPSS